MNKTMSDKEKAKQIAEESQILSDFPHDYHSVEYGALEMAKWKDKQMIEKACKWLNDNVKVNGAFYCFAFKNKDIEAFKKAMEE